MPKNEQGISFERYMVIPRCLVFITRGEDVLLLKGAPNKRIWANKYNGIGGHLERGEDPKSAAQRELKEEAGLDGIDLWLGGVAVVDVDENVGVAIYIFRGEDNRQELHPSHEGTLEWLRIADIGRYPLVDDLYVMLPVLLRMKQGDVPLSMRYYYDGDNCMQVDIAK